MASESRIEALLNSANIDTRDKGANVGANMVNICCPFCLEHRFHCGIHKQDLWFKCFVCGTGGRWWKLVTILQKSHPHISWQKVATNSDTRWITPVQEAQPVEKLSRNVSNRDSELLNWIQQKPSDDQLHDRFRPRGLNLDIALDAGLQTGINRLQGYAVFNNSGNIVARKFQQNAYGPIWWRRTPQKPYIFGEEWITKIQPDIGVITEGVFDCLRLPLGFSVALLGSTINDDLINHVAQRFHMAKKLILALDKAVNTKTISKLQLELKDAGFNVFVVNWNQQAECKDIDEMALQTGEKSLLNFLQIMPDTFQKVLNH